MTVLAIIFGAVYACYLLAFFAFSIWHSEDKRARAVERVIERQGLHLHRFLPATAAVEPVGAEVEASATS